MTAPRDWSGFTKDVVMERARLALVDPDGEADAVAPLTVWRASQIVVAMATIEADRPKRRPDPFVVVRDQRRRASERLANEAILDAIEAEATAHAGHVRCPAHEDRAPSLSWKLVDDRLLLHCFAGCTFDEILGALP